MHQRPQHLLTRFGRLGTVHLWEEPVFEDRNEPGLAIAENGGGVRVITPLLPHGLSDEGIVSSQRTLLDGYLREQQMGNFVSWYYTAMALRFSGHLSSQVVIYDCMDELSAFQGAPPELIDQEQRLFASAGFDLFQIVLGTTPNMAPPSSLKKPVWMVWSFI